jgi:ribosomal protein S18 acetylase RimI-like enzyme
MSPDLSDRAQWARILAVDETSHEYNARREDAPGAVLFTNSRKPDASLALIQQSTGEDASRALEAVIGHYSRLGLDTRVRLTPVSEPGDWPQRLARRGFAPLEEEDELFMALTPPGTAAAEASALGLLGRQSLAVRRASPEPGAEVGAEVVARTQMAGFGESMDDLDQAIEATQRSLAAGRSRFYVAYVNCQVAAAGSARMVRDAAGGVAGLYGLATLPAARRQGAGSALVTFVVNEAEAEGCDLVFLSATPGSPAVGLYARLGFTPIFSVRNYRLRLREGDAVAAAYAIWPGAAPAGGDDGRNGRPGA